jgi:hypothetical protein
VTFVFNKNDSPVARLAADRQILCFGPLMAIILDADVILRGEKSTFDLRTWVAAPGDGQFEIAAITLADLWHGVERATGLHSIRRER